MLDLDMDGEDDDGERAKPQPQRKPVPKQTRTQPPAQTGEPIAISIESVGLIDTLCAQAYGDDCPQRKAAIVAAILAKRGVESGSVTDLYEIEAQTVINGLRSKIG